MTDDDKNVNGQTLLQSYLFIGVSPGSQTFLQSTAAPPLSINNSN